MRHQFSLIVQNIAISTSLLPFTGYAEKELEVLDTGADKDDCGNVCVL